MALRRRSGQFRNWLEEVEQTWLGWSFPPADRALAETDWKPDDRGAYCERCGTTVGRGEVTDRGCGSCRSVPVATDALVRLGPYSGQLRDWILAIKYQQWAEMADAMGRQLGVALSGGGLLGAGDTVVVPTPMPWQRRIYRGIDHARVIAAGTAAELRVPLRRVLAKANGRPQVARSLSERQKLGGRGLRLRAGTGKQCLAGLNVVLIDDVRTTGASLNAAARLLRRLGAEQVVAGVLAVSDELARRARAEQAPVPRRSDLRRR